MAIAEVLAIHVSITGESDALARVVVSAAVIGLTFLAVGLLVAPWIEKLPTAARRIAVVALLANSVFVVVLAVRVFDTAIWSSHFERIGAEVLRLQEQTDEADQEELQARVRYWQMHRRPGESRPDFQARRLLARMELIRLRGRSDILRTRASFERERLNRLFE